MHARLTTCLICPCKSDVQACTPGCYLADSPENRTNGIQHHHLLRPLAPSTPGSTSRSSCSIVTNSYLLQQIVDNPQQRLRSTVTGRRRRHASSTTAPLYALFNTASWVYRAPGIFCRIDIPQHVHVKNGSALLPLFPPNAPYGARITFVSSRMRFSDCQTLP